MNGDDRHPGPPRRGPFAAFCHWCLPPALHAPAIHILHRLQLRSEVRHLLPQNREFQNIHAGRRCFILATGPSIKTQDLRPLASEFCIAVSHFFLHEHIRIIKPRYHIMAPWHAPFGFDEARKVFQGMRQAYDPSTTVFIGYTPYERSLFRFLKQEPDLAPPNLRHLDYTHSRPLDQDFVWKHAAWDITTSPFLLRTVSYGAIQLAAYMGFKEIYLVGTDHDYITDFQASSGHHFYPESQGKSDDTHLSNFSTEERMEGYALTWKHYRFMREALAARGIKVYNATAGGLLDVFPRVSLTEALAPRTTPKSTQNP